MQKRCAQRVEENENKRGKKYFKCDPEGFAFTSFSHLSHILLRFFCDGNNLPFVTILRSPLSVRLLANEAGTMSI